jgi:flagellum-specific peptidoglycan hydrolase FlgJ
MIPKDFVAHYYKDAVNSEKQTGISALFTLAQAAYEAAWGEKAIGNNFFGIKKSSWDESKCQLITTTEYSKVNTLKFPIIISITKTTAGYKYLIKDWFRKYNTPAECFADHGNFFIQNKRYSEALKVKSDPNLFADAIAKAGYATDPNYAKTLKQIIAMIKKELK